MRQHLYRGKRRDNGEWVEGSLIGNDVIVGPIIDFNDEYINPEFWWKVIPETVGKYTEFQDRKEKPIYECDIVRFADKYNYIVKWDDGRWVCDHTVTEWGRWGNLHRAFEFDFTKYSFDVIGNIHDNPELLKGG